MPQLNSQVLHGIKVSVALRLEVAVLSEWHIRLLCEEWMKEKHGDSWEVLAVTQQELGLIRTGATERNKAIPAAFLR